MAIQPRYEGGNDSRDFAGSEDGRLENIAVAGYGTPWDLPATSMENWEHKLDLFLTPWRQMPELVGIIACGSFVTGNPNPNSDLDVHLILADSVTWRERGNQIVEGLLIEYFANPPRQVRAYFTEDYESYSLMAATQFITGKVILDKTGDLASLREEARQWAEKPFPVGASWQTELAKYSLWDSSDDLADAAKRAAPDLVFLYHIALQQLFTCYSRFLGCPIPCADKIYACLTSAAVRRKYLQPEFPDQEFANAFAEAMSETNTEVMLERFQMLTHGVLRKMGGFEIDGWFLRTSVS